MRGQGVGYSLKFPSLEGPDSYREGVGYSLKFPSLEGLGVGFSLDNINSKLYIMRWLDDVEITILNPLTTEDTEEHGEKHGVITP
jgi:hypothetical protein